MLRPKEYRIDWQRDRASRQQSLSLEKKLDVVIHNLDKIVMALEALQADRTEDKVKIYQQNEPPCSLDPRSPFYDMEQERFVEQKAAKENKSEED